MFPTTQVLYKKKEESADRCSHARAAFPSSFTRNTLIVMKVSKGFRLSLLSRQPIGFSAQGDLKKAAGEQKVKCSDVVRHRQLNYLLVVDGIPDVDAGSERYLPVAFGSSERKTEPCKGSTIKSSCADYGRKPKFLLRLLVLRPLAVL